ncbi:MAG TPA: delta-60 repeat domain-containing protein [Gaiellaceae bacterium]
MAALAVAGALAAPGTLDPTFGHDGTTLAYLSKTGLGRPLLMPAPAGGLALLGVGRLDGQAFVARYDRDGKLVRGFARGGVARATGFVGLEEWGAARPLPGGDLLVAGHQTVNIFNQYVLLARFLPDGKLDPNFGLRGRLRQRFGPKGCTESNPVAALGQGTKTVLAVTSCSRLGGSIAVAIARVTSAGRVDRSFGTHGVTFLEPIQGNSLPDSLARQRDGKILVGISGDEHSAAVARLLPNGRPDPTFRRHGYITFHRGPETRLDPVSGVFQLADGSILAVACLSTARSTEPVLYHLSARGDVTGSTPVPAVHGCLRSPVQVGDDVVGASSDAVVRLSPDGSVAWSVPFPGVAAVLLERGNRVVVAAPAQLGAGRYGYELRRYGA